MQAAYGVDPSDLSLRRFWVLLRRLPVGAWPDQDEPASWSAEAHLLASVIDAVNENTWVLAAVNSKRKPPRPDAMPRPGARKRRTGPGLLDMARDAYREQRQQEGADSGA